MTPLSDIAIRLDRVHFSYGPKTVLSDCSLACERGKVTAVIGPSGEGKSTILRLMCGLRRPDSGKVYVDDVDITHMTERELIDIRKKMGFAFQYSALFDSLTIAENVAFPLYEHTLMTRSQIQKRVTETLDSLGLDDVEQRLPAELSGGMQKRVGFARAIVNQPEIVLYDEPTTGLDPIMTNVILSTMKSIQDHLHATSIIVTHDLPTVFAVADSIALLFEGTIIESQPAREFRRSRNPLVQQFLEGSELGPIPL